MNITKSKCQKLELYQPNINLLLLGYPILLPLDMQSKSVNSPPLHDYINFKSMPSNEILLNLSNYAKLRNSELISSIYTLTKRLNEDTKVTTQDLQSHEWVKGGLSILIRDTGKMKVTPLN